ncbi:MAG: S46 family peptidase [Ignavibacteriae bacterium]|nr:S46 family peptidase [Ignavibacteriota bacterium]
MILRKLNYGFIIALFASKLILGQANFYEPFDINEVKWSIDDFGKMWTFDKVPVDKFQAEYGFKPSEEWLNDVQKSALQFEGGCSAAFVSEDGLIMTNHHCGRDELYTVQKEGENLLKDGFYAEKLVDERKIKGLYVEQLMLIKDVTNEIKDYMNSGNSDNEKIKLRDKMKDSLISKYNEETRLNCKIVTLYYGGKYSLYGYKRYDDIRLVMAPDFQIAATGWDWDNFTYPRYELDFMFYRAYENDKPIKVKNHFKWSKNGAVENEPIFVIGRPGKTDRLLSYDELEFLRDYTYKQSLIGFNEIYKVYFDLYEKYPERDDLLNRVMGFGNARKSYAGRISGLNNEFIMKKKLDFENELIAKVKSISELNEKYGNTWNSLKIVLNELKDYSAKNTAVRFNRIIGPIYFKIAENLIELAEQKKLPNDNRSEKFKDENLSETIKNMFPDSINIELENSFLKAHKAFLEKLLGKESELYKILYGNMEITELIKFSGITDEKRFEDLTELSGEEILNNSDPFIKYMIELNKMDDEISPKIKELNNTRQVLNQLLGEVISIIYGDKIPPDATSTLRISDGVIKGYEYNGTIAPGKTTFYGLYDRYVSFNRKTYPWGLHERWQNIPEGLDLSTSIGFASTNDIVGGNSGSSIINEKKEVVGLVHDGNIESLAGDTIFLEENNRTVATDSKGLVEALKYVYKTENLVEELLNGKLK